MKLTVAGVLPVNDPETVPVPYEQVMVPPSGFGHVNVTVGAVTLRVPLPPLVHVRLPDVGRPVTVADAEQPLGFVLVQDENVNPVRLPVTGLPVPPALVVLRVTDEAAHERVGLMNPPDVCRTALDPVLSLAEMVVPEATMLPVGHGLVLTLQSTSAEAVEAPANATRAKTAIMATPRVLMCRMDNPPKLDGCTPSVTWVSALITAL
ncbi:hypothetical protein [Conexibacter woesei]|uniref:hypothetical protein n=1 Tax=Conexibacter woesei TaxID=191495 RepID=UPI0012DFB030|nr:hypothetical protein [Conexibacter woesei]